MPRTWCHHSSRLLAVRQLCQEVSGLCCVIVSRTFVCCGPASIVPHLQHIAMNVQRSAWAQPCGQLNPSPAGTRQPSEPQRCNFLAGVQCGLKARSHHSLPALEGMCSVGARSTALLTMSMQQPEWPVKLARINQQEQCASHQLRHGLVPGEGDERGGIEGATQSILELQLCKSHT